MQQRSKKRFIAGATCPHCGAEDAIMLLIEDGKETVQCVECDYLEAKPEDPNTRLGETVIGLFKPDP
jgi:uncharacterized metal-binding protein (TIGR02443 family)